MWKNPVTCVSTLLPKAGGEGKKPDEKQNQTQFSRVLEYQQIQSIWIVPSALAWRRDSSVLRKPKSENMKWKFYLKKNKE